MHVISNVVINRCTGTGINLHVNHDTTLLRNSHITNAVGNGVFVSGERSALELLNNTFQHNNNSGYGTFVLVSPVNYYVSFYANENVFHSNNIKVLKLSIRNAIRSVIRVTNNKMINNNCENLVDVEYLGFSCLPRSLQTIVFANNQWSNNEIQSSALLFKQTGVSSCSAYKTNILLMENDFLDNTGSGIIDIQSRWPTTLILKSNLLQRNTLEKTAIYVALLYHSSSRVSVLHNTLVNNTGFQLVDVTGDSSTVVIWNNSMVCNKVDKSVLKLGNPNHVNSFNITGNDLIANSIRRRYYPFFYNPINNVATVICSGKEIFVNQNFFENPLFRWEFVLTRFLEPYEINAQYNWWGTKDKGEIIFKIFDFRWRSYLARVNFSPFLASSNVSDVTTGDTRINFRRGNILGGHVTDYVVLQKGNSPYTVIRDVVIDPNATLTVEKGVQIDIVRNVGFHVYGKLELLGEWDNPIQFDIATKLSDFDNFGVYPIRLAKGSTPWEGIVEVFYNNTWGTICDDGYSSSNGPVLCKQLGYQGYSGSFRYTRSSSSSKPVWWRYLRCNSNTHHDISSCPFQGWGVSCYWSLWTVRCDPGYWRGIRFRETANTSTISHVKFHRGGAQIHSDLSSFVLHFDVLRQSLGNVEIRNSFRGGIKIDFQEPGLIINNVEIQNPTRTRNNGYGIETSSALTCHNCSVSGKHNGLYFVEFNIQNFLNDREIKYVDALAVPELMLRKEILMCEQNMTAVVGKNDMKIITMSKYYYSSKDVECFLSLTSLSPITLVAAEVTASLYETLSISIFNLNTTNTKEFTIHQHEMYKFGPGNLAIRYWRKAYRWGSTTRFVILTSKGNTLAKRLFELKYFCKCLFNGCAHWHKRLESARLFSFDRVCLKSVQPLCLIEYMRG